MTERMYYHDPYLAGFSARVLEAVPADDGAWRVRLDRTAFYPTAGGQPFDTGMLSEARVSDVFQDGDGEVWHVVDGPLEVGSTVAGTIDWARRFDHMQQHAGDHLMAGVIHHMLAGYTIGLHIGAADSTIDVLLPDDRTRISDEELFEIERRVNRQIQMDLPIRCWFPDEAELERLPLRKDPAVDDHVRVVMMGDAECVACGGTHPSSTGQIGMLKILDARPSRGKLRISFVCGMRALSDYQVKSRAAERAAALLSTGVGDLPDATQRLLDRVKQAELELNRARLDRALEKVPQLLEGAPALPDGWRVVSAVIEGLDSHALVRLSGALTEPGRVYALLASADGDGAQLLFARSGGEGRHMGELLKAVVAGLNGKGGGRSDMAQGAANGRLALDAATSLLGGDGAP